MYQLCHFTLFGDLVIEDITKALSLAPSLTIEKGELLDMNGSLVPARTATWDLNGPDDLSLEQQVEFVVRTLWERAAEVRKLTERFSAHLVLIFSGDEEARTLTLKPDTLQKLATLNITVNCDYVADEIEDGN